MECSSAIITFSILSEIKNIKRASSPFLNLTLKRESPITDLGINLQQLDEKKRLTKNLLQENLYFFNLA